VWSACATVLTHGKLMLIFHKLLILFNFIKPISQYETLCRIDFPDAGGKTGVCYSLAPVSGIPVTIAFSAHRCKAEDLKRSKLFERIVKV
jgi:hypothetical protein